MKDSIGGNAKTAMIVNISPSIYDIQQTRDSLEFAKSTGQIKNMIESNQEFFLKVDQFIEFLSLDMCNYIELSEDAYTLISHHKVTKSN